MLPPQQPHRGALAAASLTLVLAGIRDACAKHVTIEVRRVILRSGRHARAHRRRGKPESRATDRTTLVSKISPRTGSTVVDCRGHERTADAARFPGSSNVVDEIRAASPSYQVPLKQFETSRGIHDHAGNVGEWTSTAAPDGHVVEIGRLEHGRPHQCALRDSRNRHCELSRPSTGFRCAQ